MKSLSDLLRVNHVTKYYFIVNSAPTSQGMWLLSAGGDSSCSWVVICALGHNLGFEWRDHVSSSPRGVQSEMETHADFIFGHFIILSSDGTRVSPTRWELESTVMAIQHNLTQRVEIGQAETLQFTMVMFYSHNNYFTVKVTLVLISHLNQIT